MTPLLEIRDLTVRYGDRAAVRGVTLAVEREGQDKLACTRGPAQCRSPPIAEGHLGPRQRLGITGKRSPERRSEQALFSM